MPARTHSKTLPKLSPNVYTNAFVFAMIGFAVTFLVAVLTYRPQVGVRPDAPEARNAVPVPGAEREDAILVTISSHGHVFFGGQQVDVADVPARIREQLKTGAPRTAYIRADMRSRQGRVSEVVAAIRSAGISDIVFLTEKRAEPEP